jgi:hypothetical protein
MMKEVEGNIYMQWRWQGAAGGSGGVQYTSGGEDKEVVFACYAMPAMPYACAQMCGYSIRQEYQMVS